MTRKSGTELKTYYVNCQNLNNTREVCRMTEDRIELVDYPEQGRRVAPARSIRTRKETFNGLKERFRKFRLSLLEKKLDKKVEKALTEGYTQDNADKKIAHNADVIAKLEEKIMILSRENIPENYISRRAIKLRKNMISNLTYTTTNFYGNMYTVGLENRDVVMEPGIDGEEKTSVEEEKPYIEEIKPVSMDEGLSRPVLGDDDVIRPVLRDDDIIKPVIEVPEMAAAAVPAGKTEIDVTTDSLDRQSIIDAINSSFDGVMEDTESPVIDKDEVREVVDGVFEGTEDMPTVDKDVVRTAVDEAFRRLEKEDMEPITPDRIRVLHNNASSVHSTQFDADGNPIPRRKKYNYTPMTDEEIRLSQIKLGFDEHGNLIDSGKMPQSDVVSRANVVGGFITPKIEDVFVPAQSSEMKPIRDVPVVVPERDDDVVSLDLDDETSMFDIVEQEERVEDTQPIIPEEMTIDDYTALKNKILHLRQQQEESQQQRLEAQQRAEDAAARAQEARRLYEVSQANYTDRMKKLRDYAATLEAACTENEKSIAEAEQRFRESDGFIQSQREEMDRTNRIVSEIDSMIGDHSEPEATTSLTVVK